MCTGGHPSLLRSSRNRFNGKGRRRVNLKLPKRAADRIAHSPRIFLFLDYDGTLAPIAKRPERALLPKGTKAWLAKLRKLRGVRVAVISGRPVNQLVRMVGLSGLVYGGNHGSEIRGDDFEWALPRVKLYKPLFKQIGRHARAVLKSFRGALIEFKFYGLSLHYRLVNSADLPRLERSFRKLIEPWIDSGVIRLIHGKKVWELKPNLEWDKGKAVLRLLGARSQAAGVLAIFIGDDKTDEDAFRVLRRRGITFYVGPKRTKTLAQFKLKSHREVCGVIKAIYTMRSKS